MNLYRFEDTLHADRVHIYEHSYRVLKETPCGYWIDIFKKKWVSKVAKKRYAYPTRFEAMTNFKARKKRQIQILSAQLDNAKAALYYFDLDIKDLEVRDAEMEIRSDS